MGLLEREREGKDTRALVELAAAGSGGLLIFEGPTGIGKSVLVAEFASRARDAGLSVHVARATALSAEIPFALARWLLGEVVRDAPELLEVGWARHARPLFDGGPGAGEARLLIEGLVDLVGALRHHLGPLAFAVDDVQWGDAGSLGFLTELGARAADIGVAMALAVRSAPDTADAASLQRLRVLAGAGHHRLAPLGESAVAQLVTDRLPAADADFIAAAVTASGGNPRLVAALIDDAARREAGGLEVPTELGQIVLSRLAEVSPGARALAEALAVLAEAPLRLAGALAGLDDAAADRAADELVAHEILSAGEPVAFAQPLLGTALATTLGPFRLAARHRRAAVLLGEDGASAEEVATHLMRARPAGDAWACDTLRRAARTAMERGAPALAVRLLERALAEPPEVALRHELWLELADARASAGQPEAIEEFERALAGIGDPPRRADAWRRLSRLLFARGDIEQAVSAGARGRAELPPGEPLAERLLAAELTAASSSPRLAAEAIRRLDALTRGPVVRDPELLAMLVTHQAARVVRVDQVVPLARRAVAADPLVDSESHAIPLMYVAGALNFIDEPVLAETLLDRGLERAAELGDPLAELNVRSVRAWARLFQGDLTGAGQDIDTMRQAGELGWPSIDALCAMPMIVLRLELNDLDGARDALVRAPPGAQVSHAWYAGAVALAAGDPATALRHFSAAGDELETGLGVVNPGVLPWRSSAALAAAQLGDLDAARALVAVEVRQAEAAGGARALGIALRVSGQTGDDRDLLVRSVDVLEASPARLELARSLLALGVSQRRGGAVAQARRTLTRAQELAESCGALALIDRSLAELRAAGARARGGPLTGPGALSASERQVADLAASGRTTRQIAAILFLSPKTVEGHLTAVFRKLGISSRTQLAASLSGQPGQPPD